MDGLRGLLLLFGLFVIVGVYFYSRRERQQKETGDSTPSANEHKRLEPSLAANNGGEDESVELLGDTPLIIDADAEPAAAEAEQKVITLRIVAAGQTSFAGDDLVLSLRGIGMRHGKFGIFHRYDGLDENSIVFSIASLVEPGSFDLANLKEQKIPGISLFMVLPGPMEGVEAFDLMMVAARALAQSLNAEMLDESGSTLSIQRERYMREEIIQFQTSHRVA